MRRVLWLCLGVLCVSAFVALAGCAYVPPPTSPTVVPPVVVVENPPPPALPPPTPVTLSLTSSRAENFVGEGLSLRAIEMSGVVLSPATYAWTFGDGATSTTATSFAGHVYQRTGSFAATVSVRDRDGQTADASTTITVNRRPSPPRDPPPPADPPPSLGVTLTCTAKAATFPTPCNVTVRYDGETLRSAAVTKVDWDWGDGHTSNTPGPSDSWAYPQAGTYTIFAEVTADTKDGSKQGERSLTITVP